MNIETLLREEIQNEFEALNGIEKGTEPYKTTVDGLTKLMDRAIELEKIENDVQDKAESREIETKLKEKQMDEDLKDRFIKNCLTAAGIIIPSLITIWGTCKSLKFEEEGTVTTIMGRGFINKLLPKK